MDSQLASEFKTMARFRHILFFVYVTLCLGMCTIRRNFMWTSGDDPNLLNQSILMSKGYKINRDFVSGYPGLSQKIQQFIVELFGTAPLSQHIYSLIMSTVIGFVVFYSFKSINPIWLLMVLVFVYTQTFLVNPTPNPGHLFSIFALLSISRLFKFFDNGKKIELLLAIIFATLSVLAKQYGVILIFCIISSITLISVKNKANLFRIVLAILILINVISGIGYFTFGVTSTNKVSLLPSAIIWIVTIALLSTSLFRYSKFEIKRWNDRLDLRIIPIGVVLGFLPALVIYGLNLSSKLIYDLFIEYPRQINTITSPLVWNLDSIKRVFLGLVLFLLIEKSKSFSKSVSFRSGSLGYLSVVMASFCLVTIGNLSGTLFIPALLVLMTFQLSRVINRENLNVLIVLISSGPFFAILIPYPNYSFHLPILTYLYLKRLESIKKIEIIPGKIEIYKLGIAIFLVLAFLAKESADVNKLPRFTSGEISFVSYDENWADTIKDYTSETPCSTFACWYLQLNGTQEIDIVNYPGIHETINPLPVTSKRRS